MSDPFTDAYRPDWKPKGYGWWADERKKEHLKKLLEMNVVDIYYWYECFMLKVISQEVYIEKYKELINDPVSSLRKLSSDEDALHERQLRLF
jgi:hypothetical protein